MVRAAGLAGCCNYFLKKKKKDLVGSIVSDILSN